MSIELHPWLLLFLAPQFDSLRGRGGLDIVRGRGDAHVELGEGCLPDDVPVGGGQLVGALAPRVHLAQGRRGLHARDQRLAHLVTMVISGHN